MAGNSQDSSLADHYGQRLPTEKAVDHEAAEKASYLEHVQEKETLLDPSGIEVPDEARRFIKSEVGVRAISDLMAWYERQWADSVDFKDELIELLDASKFGTKEYTPGGRIYQSHHDRYLQDG